MRIFLAGITALVFSGWAAAEPPSRAARLSYTSGEVSFAPAGESDWGQATVNRPLTTGDRLWVDANSRAELQVGGAAIRLGAATSMTLLNLDDRIAQVKLSQGTLKVRVRHMRPNQIFEVDTPNLAFTLRRPGEYRIDVDPDDDATVVMVRSGEAEVYGDGASYTINAQQGYRFYGTSLRDYETLAMRRDDDLDRWAHERDSRGDNSPSARFVSPDVVGYEDLDANGTWRSDPNYGNVWMPNRVAAGWTPYHDGHWAWVDPWGWTWVDDAPWGFAVSHYGRWANISGSWGWVPGPSREQAVYAPAQVAFVGGKNLGSSLSISVVVGWFPLAPREVYQPSYPVSRGYFDNINRSNAVIAPANITKVYNTTNVTNNTTIVNTTNNINVTRVAYVNQQVPGAVVAVPAKAFVQSQPVAKTAVAVSTQAASSAPVANLAGVAPVAQSVHGGAAAGAKPPAREQAVVARTAPPAPPVAFALQQQHLAAKPGAPLDDVQRKQLKPATATPPKVSVVATAQAAAPTAPPPATAPAGKSPEARKAAAGKTDSVKPAAANAEATRVEAAKADALKAAAVKADATKAEAAKIEASRPTAAKAEVPKVDAVKAEAAKAPAAKAETKQADAAKADALKAAAVKAEATKAEAKIEASRPTAAKAEVPKIDAVKAEAAKAPAAKAETKQADAAKAEALKSEAVKADAGKAAAARATATRAEAAKAEALKAEAVKADAAKAARAKADAARAEASRLAAAKAEALKAEAVKAEAAKAAAAKVEAAKVARAKAKAEASRGEMAKPDDEKKKPEEDRQTR